MDSSSHCKDMTKCFISLPCVSVSTNYWAQRPWQTPVITHVATTCFRTWLSQEHTPDSPSTSLLQSHSRRVASCHPSQHLSQAVTTRWNQCCYLILVALQYTPVSAQGVLDEHDVCKHGWMCCPHALGSWIFTGLTSGYQDASPSPSPASPPQNYYVHMFFLLTNTSSPIYMNSPFYCMCS